MGVGKSTIGKQLAQRFNLSFQDSDYEIEQRTGASISWIFDLEGEEGFRKREHAVITELTALNRIVLATGGGTIVNEENRRLLQERGFVIYLYASVDTLVDRTAFCRNRPLLQTKNPQEKIEALLTERHPLYKQVADMTVETGNRTVRQVIKNIIKRIKNIEKHGHSTR